MNLRLPVGLHKSWWALLSAEWVMESVKVGVVGVSVLPSLLPAEIQCSEIDACASIPPNVQVLVSDCRTLCLLGSSGLYLCCDWAWCLSSLGEDSPLSPCQDLLWRPQEVSAMS